ncbi:MAG: hypothetical protein V7631_3113 [Massilia sp.]|jgi:hypothetical protein
MRHGASASRVRYRDDEGNTGPYFVRILHYYLKGKRMILPQG